MYHDISPASDARALWHYRVTPTAFESQLQYLRRAGFRSVTLAEWVAAMHYRKPLPGRNVCFTFDDAYRNFVTHAVPLLEKYGFSAIVFVPCDFVGATNAWDRGVAEELALLDWSEMRHLASRGIAFGAHALTHTPMTGLTNAAAMREASESKRILERELGVRITAFAYPHGDNDPIVQRLVAASGYTVAVTTRFGRAGLNDARMALPRIDVTAHDDLAAFVRKLGD
jgi:peptidoglycan/xylan/chitin deacetylase (PgdA/CDA1 family)